MGIKSRKTSELKGRENLLLKGSHTDPLTLRSRADIQVEESHRVPNKTNPKRNTVTHIIIKIGKVKGKESILKCIKKKKNTYYIQGKPHEGTSRFSAEILQT